MKPSSSRRPRTLLLLIRGALVLGALLLPIAAAHAGGSIEGRWRTADGIIMVIDMGRCGLEFCGRLVESGGRCGPQILKVRSEEKPATETSAKPAAPEPLVMSGILDLSAGTKNKGDYGAYTVGIIVPPGKSGDYAFMKMLGGDRYRSIFSRDMPINFSFKRVGNAACQPDVNS